MTDDTAQAFAETLDHLARVRRRPDADEPRDGVRTLLAEAAQAAAEARHALERTHGPAAVRAAEAHADLRAITEALTAARAAYDAGVRVDELDVLVAQEREAAARAEKTTEAARIEADAMVVRIELECDHAAELTALAAILGEKGRRLAAAAARAEAALCDLYRQAAAYTTAVDDARVRLAATGFTVGGHFNGTPFPTQAAEVLTVSGHRWPAVDPVEAVARSAWRVALAAGPRGRTLADALRPRAGRAGAAEPVLANTPMPRLEAGRADA